ncbi:MAG: Ldh family oxidoreductase [Wenzhouxiangella sp.]
MSFVAVSDFRTFCSNVLQRCDVPEKHAAIIADTIVDAHQSGKATHGVTRLPIYVRKIRAGLMDPETRIKVIRDAGVVSVIDANHGFGQVAAAHAMKRCIDRASDLGVGVVGVRHSNNFGVAGYFARMATAQGHIGIVMANSAPAIAPTGGNKPLLGTNPIAIGFPTAQKDSPIVLDMAVSEAARGKVRLAEKEGRSIPENWALDPSGQPTTDPTAALAGSMLPLAGPKGYGLALVVDMFAGLLTGGAFAGAVKPLNEPDVVSDHGHWVMAVAPDFFIDREEYLERVDVLMSAVQTNADDKAVLLPGQRSNEARQTADEFIELGEAARKVVTELSCAFGFEQIAISDGVTS